MREVRKPILPLSELGVWCQSYPREADARITALEAANAAQSVRIATLLEDNHCIPELEARIKELESDAVQWQQSRDWFALKCIALRDKLKQFNVEDDEIMEVTRRAASALGDQHER